MGDKEKLGKVIKDREEDLADILAISLFMMYALHDLPDGVSASDIVYLVGEPHGRIDAIQDSDISYDEW